MKTNPEQLSEFFKEKDLRQLMSRLKGQNEFGKENEKEIIIKLREGLRNIIKEREKPLFTFKETYRFSTKDSYINSLVKFLENEIKGKRIIDCTCGIGKGVIGLSKIAKEVIGIEIEPIRAILAENNIKYNGITNAKIINDDAKSEKSIEQIKKSDIIFIDPERIESSKERSIEENKPELEFFVDNFPKHRIIYEISPRIPLDNAPLNASIILFSHYKRHARTILLFNFYNERKIIVLNENNESFTSHELIEQEYSEFNTELEYIGKYLIDIDETLAKVGMLHKLSRYGIREYYKEGKTVFGILEEKKIIPFCDTRKIIFESNNEKEVIEEIRKNKFGKILLKYSISPELYSTEARKFASKGDGKAYLYKIKEKYYLCLE